MAAYVTTHDRSVLPKRYEETKVSITQSATHENILGNYVRDNFRTGVYLFMHAVSSRILL